MKFSIELSEYSAETRKMMAKETKDSEFLDILVKDKDIEVVLEAIRNSEIKGSTVEELSKSKNVRIKCEVAKKTKISREAIVRLFKDKDEGVRYCVAITPYEEPHRDIVIRLAKDPNNEVRQGLVEHGLGKRDMAHDEEILKILIDDPYHIVRCFAAELTRDSDKLHQLHTDEDWTVRVKVIKNPATKRTTIKNMQNDPNDYCRLCVYQLLKFGKIFS